ncbi:hypothetical protein PV08_04039 [Exophiala spinifera]|uniref:Mid2 domain-containing protein n=1 Tax=Exophiala spinifera TaxID=91928 RepID=A0A0D2BZR9_9EURO|nr:uncharacterized protein PV08_04039 [Exophiala spinifera]KIW16849.1 hypothetical protein PV08_04039 [Exophiala spinifera]
MARRASIGLILVCATITHPEVAALDRTGTYFTNPPEYGDYPDDVVNYTVQYGEIPYFTWRTNLSSINLVLPTFLDVEYSKGLTYPDGSFTSKYGSGFYLIIEDAETDYAVATSMYFSIVSQDTASSTSATTKSTTKPASSMSAQGSVSSITAITGTGTVISMSALLTPSTFNELEPTTTSTSFSPPPSPSETSVAGSSSDFSPSINAASSDQASPTSIRNPQSKDDTSQPASPSSKTTSIAASVGGVCAAIILGVVIYMVIRRHKQRQSHRHRHHLPHAPNTPTATSDVGVGGRYDVGETTHHPTDSNAQATTTKSNHRSTYSILPTFSPSDDIKARLALSSSSSSSSSSLYAYTYPSTRPPLNEVAAELPAQQQHHHHHHHSAELPG